MISPGRPRTILDDYLLRTGLLHPADVAQQYQVALIRQCVDHLAAVLDAELTVSPPVADRIIRGFIWGSIPQHAEADFRTAMVADMTELRKESGLPG